MSRDPLAGYDEGDDLDFLEAGPIGEEGKVHVIKPDAPLRLPRALRGVITDPNAISMWHLLHGTVQTICGRTYYRHRGRKPDVNARSTDCFADDRLCWACHGVLERAGQAVRAFQHGYPLTVDQARGRLLGRPTADDPGTLAPDWAGYPAADVDKVLADHPADRPVSTADFDAYLRELDYLGDLRDGAAR